MKKIHKFMALGPLTMIPLVAATSMAANHAAPTAQQWRNFLVRVYDQERPWDMKGISEDILSLNVFYQDITRRKINEDTLHSVLEAIFVNKSLDLKEKHYTAKWVLRKDMFSNFLERIGIKNIVEDSDQGKKNTFIPDPIFSTKESKQNVKIDGKEVKEFGTTGINKDWGYKDPGAKLGIVSNSDQYNLLVSTIFKGEEFKSIIDYVKKEKKLVVVHDDSLEGFFNSLNKKITQFWQNLKINSELKLELKKIGIFSNLFHFLEQTNTGNDLNRIKGFGKTVLAKKIFGTLLESKMKEYRDIPSNRSFIAMEIVHALEGELNNLFTYESNLFKNAKEFFGKIDNKSNSYLMNMAILMFKETKLKYSFEFATRYDFKNSGSIAFRSSEDQQQTFTKIDPKIIMPTIKVGQSMFDIEIIWRENKIPLVYGRARTVDHQENKDIIISEGREYPETKVMLRTTHARNVYMKAAYFKNDNSILTNEIKVYEDDHNNISTARNSEKFILNFKNSLSFKNKIDPSQIGHVKIYLDFDQNKTIESSKTFVTFTKFNRILLRGLKNIESKIKDKINNDIKMNLGKAFNNKYKYRYILKVNAVDFGIVRFYTYNDFGWDRTHIEHITFENMKLNYNYKIIRENL